MTEKRICRDFIKNPKKDPIDGHRLVPGKNPYRGYVAMCLENDFDVDYMLNDDFIRELSSNPKKSTSPSGSPRNISIPRSPRKSTPMRSPLRSEPVLPRSVPSITKQDNVSSRSINKNLNLATQQVTQTVYPRVVSPARSPNASYTTRTEQIGVETFDPDPITTVTKIPGTVEKKVVRGPYGQNGENTVVSGVYKSPGIVVYSTSDIPEHEVRSVHNGYNLQTSTNKVLYPPPVINSRSEKMGNERFDPDPVTTVTNIPAKSVRTLVRGPYGPSGENVITAGVYTTPAKKIYTTADIPEHEIRSLM